MKKEKEEYIDAFDIGWDTALRCVMSKLQLRLHKDEIELIKEMIIKQKESKCE